MHMFDSTTAMSDFPPAYTELSNEHLLRSPSAVAPPPEYDCFLVVPAVAQTPRSRYVGPSATDMATATPPAYSAVAEYPDEDELEEVMPVKKQSKIAKLIFRKGKWLNAWCGGCNQRIPYNDRLGVKFLSCSKCSLMTPVENAVPRDPTKKFVHCDGKCGHQLLIVPADAESFVCPAENMVRYPRHHAVQKNGPAGSKTLLRTTESAFPSWSGSAALDTKFPSQVGAGL